MKRMMADRQKKAEDTGKQANMEDLLWPQRKNVGIIDGTFLSFALCGALCTIIVVAAYAFYALYNAVLKKFPSQHTEL